jgi:hypothetical protein
MRDPIDQRVAEGDGQPGKDQRGPDGDYGDRQAPAWHEPPLQRKHQGVQQQRDEPRDDDQEQDISQPVDDLAQQIDGDHDPDGGEDRAQRDIP